MSRRWFAFALPALVATGMLVFADQAQAQRWGRGMGYGLGLGYGSPYYGGYGFGNAYSPYYGGYGWGNNYAGWGNGYYGNRFYTGAYNTYPNTWDYSWNYPSGTSYGTTGMYGNTYSFAPQYNYSGMNTADFDNMNMQGGYTSFYSNDQRERIPERAALINVRLPGNAKVWFFDDETKSQGSMRQFVTPDLDTGRVFYYDIKARWNEGGRDVDRSHRVLVRAGDRINVDMMRDMTAVDEMTPEHLRQQRERVRPEATNAPRGERRFYEEERNRTPGEAPPPPAGQEAFLLLEPGSLDLKQGESKDVTIKIDRSRGFDQPVTIKFERLPEGVSVEPTNADIRAGSDQASFRLKTTNNAQVGDTKVRITGTPRNGEPEHADMNVKVERGGAGR